MSITDRSIGSSKLQRDLKQWRRQRQGRRRVKRDLWQSSGGPTSRQATNRNYKNRTTCIHSNGNPCKSFFIVKMASGTDRGRVRPTTTTTSHNMAATLQLIPSSGLRRTFFIFDIHVMINWRLSKQDIRWLVSRTISRAQVNSSSKSCVF